MWPGFLNGGGDTDLTSKIWKCLNSTAPGYLSKLCIPVASASGRQHLRSTLTGLLQVPMARTTIDRQSFAVAGPPLWNSLPAALWRPEMTLHTFKRQLKAYLFHIWCAGKQKEHSPPSGAVVVFRDSGAGYKNEDLVTYLHEHKGLQVQREVRSGEGCRVQTTQHKLCSARGPTNRPTSTSMIQIYCLYAAYTNTRILLVLNEHWTMVDS